MREPAPFLADGAVEVASLPYVDPARFDLASAGSNALSAAIAVAIAPENVSLLEKTDELGRFRHRGQGAAVIAEGASLRKMLIDGGRRPERRGRHPVGAGGEFLLRFPRRPEASASASRPIRRPARSARCASASTIPNDRHIATVALSDSGTYVAAQEPALDGALGGDETAEATTTARSRRCTRGSGARGLTLGMTDDVIKNLVHIFSYDVDYQARLSPSDSLEVIYSAEGEAEGAGDSLRRADRSADVTHRFYRFRDPERRLGRLL